MKRMIETFNSFYAVWLVGFRRRGIHLATDHVVV